MKNNKKGISLIVLVITIIVIIILAAAVILTLTSNNPIQSANAAKIAQNKDSIESALNLYVAQKTAATQGQYSNLEILTAKVGGTGAAISGLTATVSGTPSTNASITGCYLLDQAAVVSQVGITMPEAAGTPLVNSKWYIDPATNKVYYVYPSTATIPSAITAMDFVKKLV